ncbi:aldo/keto reductase [Flagellimonas allohymeniacidonis]|uniref:Aldo/keto reductase n=1 Tax=Flagellimonas allohymeniacidonis TaxID=2517819 RepID=A0A4Q8QGL4_9FLAO|nr:aldo/keto reductase [Allomuricauda hymeniacidonis]TAI47733.1 aldo/keto reductase [Allomuricauda hymeniacidonis]
MEDSNNFSKIIAGTMTWGSWGKQLSKRQIIDLMQHCVEIGLTTFDHADIYGDYSTEQDFGKAFAESDIPRDQIQLITKCGIQMTSGRPNKLKHYQYDKNYIIGSAEESLRKLNTEYLDLFLLHRPSPLIEPDEIAAAIDSLLASGKIRNFGVSNFTPSQIAMVEKAVPISANQVEFSLTHCSPMYDGTFDDCIAQNRTAMAWSPLGIVFREKNERTNRIKEVLSQLKGKYDVEESQLLLAWLLRHPAGVYPVIGTTTKERLELSVQAASIHLELQDWFLLLEASNGHEVP